MKTKNIDKKLSLNKKTIVHLNDDEMNTVQGKFEGKCLTPGCASTSASPLCSNPLPPIPY